MQLSALIRGERVLVASGDPTAIRICDLTEDSRTVVPGSLFVARRGRTTDGRLFIDAALDAGAAAVLTDDPGAVEGVPGGRGAVVVEDVAGTSARVAERFFGEPSRRLVLTGVTGTNGKTTVAHLVHHLLNAAGVRCGLIGTVEVDDGSGRVAADMTTPPAIDLSRTLAAMVEAGCDAAVMEVSSHALDQGRASALSFDIGIITNLTRDHLDYHGTMEAYAAAKGRLFELVDAGPSGPGLSIVNADDPEAASLGGRRRLACSMAGDAIGGWSVRLTPGDVAGAGERLRGPGAGGPIEVEGRVSLIGSQNAMNICQAAAAAAETLRSAGFDQERIGRALAHGLSLAHPPAGRLEPVHTAGDDIAVLVDYAHTDDALDRALSAVRRSLPAERLVWAVFGAGGERDAGKRPRMGRAAALRADRVIVTSDNPRSESPSAIIEAVLSGIPAELCERVQVHADRSRAIAEAVAQASAGDAVVILGKGHEAYQVLPSRDGMGGTVRVPFDDRAEARRALERRRSRAGALAGAGC